MTTKIIQCLNCMTVHRLKTNTEKNTYKCLECSEEIKLNHGEEIKHNENATEIHIDPDNKKQWHIGYTKINRGRQK